MPLQRKQAPCRFCLRNPNRAISVQDMQLPRTLSRDPIQNIGDAPNDLVGRVARTAGTPVGTCRGTCDQRCTLTVRGARVNKIFRFGGPRRMPGPPPDGADGSGQGRPGGPCYTAGTVAARGGGRHARRRSGRGNCRFGAEVKAELRSAGPPRRRPRRAHEALAPESGPTCEIRSLISSGDSPRNCSQDAMLVAMRLRSSSSARWTSRRSAASRMALRVSNIFLPQSNSAASGTTNAQYSRVAAVSKLWYAQEPDSEPNSDCRQSTVIQVSTPPAFRQGQLGGPCYTRNGGGDGQRGPARPPTIGRGPTGTADRRSPAGRSTSCPPREQRMPPGPRGTGREPGGKEAAA